MKYRIVDGIDENGNECKFKLIIPEREKIGMYECIKPTQYVKEHEDDYLFQKQGKYYIRTYYGGTCELTKEKYEEYKNKGVVER